MNRAEYQSAYDHIVVWSGDDRNLALLFDRDVPTIRALSVLAWKGDRPLLMRILTRSPSALRSKMAIEVAAVRDFDLMHRYFRCYFKPTGPSVRGCEHLARQMATLDRTYEDIWLEQ